MKNKEQANLYNNAATRVLRKEGLSSLEILNKNIHNHDSEYTGISYNCLGVSFKEKLIELKKQNNNLDVEDIINYIFNQIIFLTNEQSGGIGILNIDYDLEMFCGDIQLEELIKIIRRFFNNLNLPLRNGYEKAYVTFNLGLSTSEAGRKVSLAFLKAFRLGNLLNNEPFIFPNIVFKLKEGINKNPCDRNYDLFQEAVNVTSLRMNPTYFNCDSLLIKNIDCKKLGIMGCRTLLGNNIYKYDGAQNRGNIATVSINLPSIALNSKNEDDFINKLIETCNESKEILLKKYKYLLNNNVENFSYILKNELFYESKEALEKKDLNICFKHGTLSIGFIGLFDCISNLRKKELNLDFIENSLELAEKILKIMRGLTDLWSKNYKLNFSLIATAGESLCYKFAKNDVTKEYYTNSFHVPVYIPISPFRKLEIESVFSKYCNGGSISYVEFETPILNNSLAITDILIFAINLGLTYIGINFPLDYCSDCKTTSVFENDSCSCCNGKNITKLRRVSGYLTTKETLRNGKKQEEKARIAHFKGENI